MLFLERECKAIDDAAQNLQELCYAIMSFCLPYKSKKDIVDGFPHKGPVNHEFAIDPAENAVHSSAVAYEFACCAMSLYMASHHFASDVADRHFGTSFSSLL